jgi:hypothetical protein
MNLQFYQQLSFSEMGRYIGQGHGDIGSGENAIVSAKYTPII